MAAVILREALSAGGLAKKVDPTEVASCLRTGKNTKSALIKIHKLKI